MLDQIKTYFQEQWAFMGHQRQREKLLVNCSQKSLVWAGPLCRKPYVLATGGLVLISVLLFAAGLTAKAAGGHCAPRGVASLTGPSVQIKGSAFMMGSDTRHPEERPRRQAWVLNIEIDRYEVTNAGFAEFVAATGYVTVAERPADPALYPGAPPELLKAGSFVFAQPETAIDLADFRQWWRFVPDANWRQPEGPGSTVKGRGEHPVVHVVYQDAMAYAQWKGRDLPTEAEWEFAAKGGNDTDYSWGNDRLANGQWQANVWQGLFPLSNKLADGFEGTSPVGCFMPNGYGLFDMAGNVWEITKDDYSDLRGPQKGMKTIKGGSHLCGENYCDRYRPSARQPASTDAGASHIGFRTVKRLSGEYGL